MSLCFFDTNILIYAPEAKSPKQAVSEAWIRTLANEGRIVVSPQALNEFAQNVRWKMPDFPLEALIGAVDALAEWCPMAMTRDTTQSALALHRRFGYTIYDSANVVMAIEAGCRFFVSEDRHHRHEIAGMTILNPFKAELAEISHDGRA